MTTLLMEPGPFRIAMRAAMTGEESCNHRTSILGFFHRRLMDAAGLAVRWDELDSQARELMRRRRIRCPSWCSADRVQPVATQRLRDEESTHAQSVSCGCAQG